MASIKVASLLLKTLAKPLANRIKSQAKDHEKFRQTTINIAQFMHRTEMHLRTKLLGETHHPKHIRPLNDVKAIDAGANFLSESFLFGFATLLILGETWRSRRKEGARRDLVADTLEAHEQELRALKVRLDEERTERTVGLEREKDLEKIVEEIVGIGVRGGWLVDPSPSIDWEAHARRAEEVRRTGNKDVRVVGEGDRDEPESAVLRELKLLPTDDQGIRPDTPASPSQ